MSEPTLISGPKQRPTRVPPPMRMGNASTGPIRSGAPTARAASVTTNGSANAITGGGGRIPPRTAVRPDAPITASDAEVGTDAFKSRAAEITSFKVVSRVRPFIKEELAEMGGQERRSVVEMTNNTTILLDPNDNWSPKAQFEFDSSLWSIPPSHRLVHTFRDTRRRVYATQKDVYNTIAKDLVPHVFDGFNSCILSYGQTGSGKTYTMMGHYEADADCGGDGEEGIIPRVANDLFLILREREAAQVDVHPNHRTRYRVEVNFVEIYREKVRDLLDPALRNVRGSDKLEDARIRLDPCSGPFVEGVTKYQVESWAQCCTLLERGSRHRTTCATAVHNQSSRSHAIFQLTVIQETTVSGKDRNSGPTTKTLSGRINLVDLAGSERGGFQDYVKESAAINTSLLALRRCIDSLTERQNILMEQARAQIAGEPISDKPLPQVPYRDSVLTWLLSDSIGGNARTTMVATLSPLVKNYGDTLATLQWSSKARNLVTLVKVNDQAVVTDQLSKERGALGNAVQIQRLNLDHLREALEQKKADATRLEREAVTLQRQLDQAKSRKDAIERDRAAMVIQRAFRTVNAKNKLEGYERFQEKMNREQMGGGPEAVRAEERRQAAETAEREAKARLAEAISAVGRVEAQSAAIEAERPDLERRREEAQKKIDEVELQLHADELRQRHRAAVEDEVRVARAALDEDNEARAARETRLKEMRAKMDESKTAEWKERVKVSAEDLSELKRARDEQRRKRDEAAQARDASKAKLDKMNAKTNACC